VQQLLAGDSWGLVSIPIIDEDPWTLLFFLSVLVSISLCIMNIILAVIVENAQEARQDDLHRLYKLKQQDFHETSHQLYRSFSAMDEDKSGTLNRDELMSGYDSPEFRNILAHLDMKEEDMQVVFGLASDKLSETVDYTAFVHQLHKLQDIKTLLAFIKHHVKEVVGAVRQDVSLVKSDITQKLDEELSHLTGHLISVVQNGKGKPINMMPLQTPGDKGSTDRSASPFNADVQQEQIALYRKMTDSERATKGSPEKGPVIELVSPPDEISVASFI